MRCDDLTARRLLADGFARIHREFELDTTFPVDVESEALTASSAPLPVGHRFDARHLPMVTLDPASSTDLDQAFALEKRGDQIVLWYAIADVGWFVERGSALEAEAFRRGQTIYAPDGRVPQYPTVLSEDAASLLPSGDRPAVLLEVLVDVEGNSRLASARRAIVRSRAKLAYEAVDVASLGPLLPELMRRVARGERTRGALRVDLPEQGIEADPSVPGGVRLVVRDRFESEDYNSAMSLAANLAVARRMLDAGIGLFRVMPKPDRRDVRSLRNAARALGIEWPRGVSLAKVQTSLDPRRAQHRAFLNAARRAGGGATYELWEVGMRGATAPPWHAAIAAPYAHATAPLRRLADRYVLDVVMALEEAPGSGVAAGQRAVGPELRAVLAKLPDIMASSGQRAARVENAAFDLVEAVALEGREGEEFEAVVMDVDGTGARMQLADPPVRARVRADGLQPGDAIRVRLEDADPATRQVRFSAVRT